MGDYRARIKIDMTLMHENYSHEWEDINYFPDDDGVHINVKRWFKDCWEDALDKFPAKIEEASRLYSENKEHDTEIDELIRLSKKYPDVL